MDVSRDEYRKLKKAALRACKAVEKALNQEPSTVIIIGIKTGEPENIVDEITSWLFHRRQNNGSSGK